MSKQRKNAMADIIRDTALKDINEALKEDAGTRLELQRSGVIKPPSRATYNIAVIKLEDNSHVCNVCETLTINEIQIFLQGFQAAL